MTAEEFVERIRQKVLADNMAHYATSLQTDLKVAQDPAWRKILVAFHRMDREQQEAVLAFARHVMVDTISNIFGILDGSTIVFEDEFTLKYGQDPEALNGELQERFLSEET